MCMLVCMRVRVCACGYVCVYSNINNYELIFNMKTLLQTYESGYWLPYFSSLYFQFTVKLGNPEHLANSDIFVFVLFFILF